MVKMQALRPLTGDYGTVSEGQEFEVDPRGAERLEARGLACRAHIGIVERFGKAFLGAPENKTAPRVIVDVPRVLPEIPKVQSGTRKRR